MKLLLLSFYYPPDLSAGSFRMQGLVTALKRARETGKRIEIEIVTTQPNRYANMAHQAPPLEDLSWLRIHRLPLPAHRSGMRDQALAFLSYARSVERLTLTNQGWDMVFATSSRLMTAALGARIARRLSLPLYLDIRDIFTDTMGDVLRGSILRGTLPFFERLQRKTFNQARRINVVSSGFLDYIQDIVPSQNCTVFTNGIADVFLETEFPLPEPRSVPRILYAGNIGEGQGLHDILPRALPLLEGCAELRIIGDGGRATTLRERLTAVPRGNVTLHPPMARDKLLREYCDADILMLHLNDYPAFRRVLPSKIFEYAATGRPIIAGVAGHAAEFLRENVAHAHIFDPCDAEGFARAIKTAKEGPRAVDRADFKQTYAQATTMDRMAADILQTVP